MKFIPSIVVLAFALSISTFAQDTKTNTAATNQAPGQLFLASAATLTAPLVMTNDYFVLNSDQADTASGGKAVFNFSITNAGEYVIESLVNAPDETDNSYFLNIDAMPSDEMIWDVEVTTGFEKRVASWRGNGDGSNDEFSPKRFELKPGAHQIILVGREPGTLLKSVTVRPAPPASATTPATTPAPAAP